MTATAQRMLSPEALDFAPDLLAIQDRPPERLPRVLLVVVAALIALLLLWATFAKLDIIATADGRLVPMTFTKVVQPAEAGVVSEILVKDGDAVREGQLLLRLDPRLAMADTTALGTDLAVRKITLRFIEAALAERTLVPIMDERPEVFVQVQARFRAQRQAYLDALAQEAEALNRARSDLQSAHQVLDKLTQTLPIYRQSAQAYRNLQQEGFVGELAALEKAREAIEKDQEQKAQASNVASLGSAIAQSEKKVAAVRSHHRSQLENERVETLALLNRSGQEFEKSQVKAGMLEVRAPNAGVVKDLAVTTRGAVVAAGALLMNVVPVGEAMQAEVLLRNEDVGFAAMGQDVRVKVAAYPFQKYGMLDGKVALISADALDPKQAPPGQVPSLTYRAIVQLDKPKLSSVATGEQLALQAGMLVTAEIHQGRRSVLEYLLSPVRKVSQEAGRER